MARQKKKRTPHAVFTLLSRRDIFEQLQEAKASLAEARQKNEYRREAELCWALETLIAKHDALLEKLSQVDKAYMAADDLVRELFPEEFES